MHRNLSATPDRNIADGPTEVPKTAKGVIDVDLGRSKPLGSPEGKAGLIAMTRARLAESRGMDEQAIDAYREVRRHDPNQPGVAHALAVLYDRAGRSDDAAAEFKRALHESSDDADVLCDYGYFLYGGNNLGEAISAYQRALKLQPDHRQCQINLATALATRGNDSDAMALYTRAIGPAAARHNVGVIKMASGQRDAARELLSDASRRDPSVARRAAPMLAAIDRRTGPNVEAIAENDPSTVLTTRTPDDSVQMTGFVLPSIDNASIANE